MTRAFPDLQLGFLEDILATGRESAEQQADSSLKLKFLGLLCRLKPDLVANALKAYSFPLAEALQICEKAKNLQGMAHIYSWTDRVDSALKIYIKVPAPHQIIHQGFERYIDPPAQAPATRRPQDLGLPRLLLEQAPEQGASDSSAHLAEALFSYHNIAATLAREADYKNPRASEFFEVFMKYIFDVYEDLDKKDENMPGLGLEKLARYIELRRFIKSHIFDDFILLYVARVGAKFLVEVVRAHQFLKNKVKSQKLKDFGDILVRLVAQKKTIACVQSTDCLP